ncbi:outer membrane protein assembly factor BamE [Nordella sp. HKS 07]|uniref:outer membrane protein assembly factor BamE n=1 Tax=Nordella sp. HKS 07 TaxID=2712222 RepID=UPI0013E11653|nr:outer membrane protein assembly factor BamE [Nordella sp. HKS 07]QIG50911.1 outer membrane protein assembly factor BamE [Nordella sp. HKS 07]
MRRILAFSSRLLLPAAMALTVAACSSNIAHRGYLAKPGAFGQVREGMPKSEVEGILGSPSTTASMNFQGDSYYYISSTTEQTAFLNPTEVERQVIAIRFDKNDQVASLGQYGLEDGKIIDINSRTTPTKGRELTMLQQLFGNIGKPGPGGTIVPGRTPGSTGPGKNPGM